MERQNTTLVLALCWHFLRSGEQEELPMERIADITQFLGVNEKYPESLLGCPA